ncbi:MAG: 2Fe-2S iron-sulfur cluster-binding protein [Desulfosarcinaceae bacterium]|nr:2Fe-2S iron-sulfur cluster-binding protein [Desulfosarcinaceae bacterium]
MPTLTIDGKTCEAEADATVLTTAKRAGVFIPALCHHPALKPAGACKLCIVAVAAPGGALKNRLACMVKVRAGMTVTTTGDAIQAARWDAFERLLQQAPYSQRIRSLAETCGVDVGPQPDGCIRCRLCIRVCKEIVGVNALKMEKRPQGNYVVPVENRCIGCGTCVNLCPTGAIRLRDDENVRTIQIREAIVGKFPLERCEGCGKYFLTPQFHHFIEARTAPHPHVKEAHTYCPACAKLFSDRARVAVRDAAKRQPPGI